MMCGMGPLTALIRVPLWVHLEETPSLHSQATRCGSQRGWTPRTLSDTVYASFYALLSHAWADQLRESSVASAGKALQTFFIAFALSYASIPSFRGAPVQSTRLESGNSSQVPIGSLVRLRMLIPVRGKSHTQSLGC